MSLFVRYVPVILSGGGGGGSSLTMGTYDGQTHSANGATITLNQLFMQSATASFPGLVVVGNLTDVGTDGITVTGGTGAVVGSGTSIAQHVADASHNGYLSSSDWSTFNSKQATISIGAFDTTPNASGLSLSGAAISLSAADGTHPGGLTTGSQTIGGAKTFNSTISASNLSGTNTGDVTLTAVGSSPAAAGASLSGQALTLQPFDGTHPGVVPLSGGGSTNFLRADGTWNAPAGSTPTAPTSIGAFSNSSTANGLDITSNVLTLHAADGTNPGALTAIAQSIAGVKTFASAPVMTALSASQVVVTDSGKALGSLAYATAPAASTLAEWDANKNLSANNLLEAFATTATAAGTTTLAVGDKFYQYFTGSSTQTVALPVTSTLVQGQSFQIVNNSTGTVTVNSSGGNLVQTLLGGTSCVVTCILTSGTTAASWNSIPNTTVSNLTVDTFSGDNSTTAFTLSVSPASLNNTQVYISGVYQQKATYSVSGTTLTFTTAPPTGTSNIQVVSGAQAGTGAVTSVAMTVPSILSVSGSPITGSGTLAVTLANESANTVLAGPSSGGATTPTFRTMVAADLNTAVVNGTTVTVTPASAAYGTITNATAFSTIVGKSARIWGTFKCGTVGASTQLLALSGVTIDSTKLTSVTGVQQLGYATAITSASFTAPVVIFYDGSDTANVYLTRTVSSTAFQKVNGSGAFLANNDVVTYDFWIPIT